MGEYKDKFVNTNSVKKELMTKNENKFLSEGIPCSNCGKEFLREGIQHVKIEFQDLGKNIRKNFCLKCHSLFIERLDETL